jgi:hypothetical protein
VKVLISGNLKMTVPGPTDEDESSLINEAGLNREAINSTDYSLLLIKPCRSSRLLIRLKW